METPEPPGTSYVSVDEPAAAPEPAIPLRPAVRRVGMRPALIVIALAAVIVVGFGIGAVVTSSTPPPAPSSTPVPVPGTQLKAIPAASALRPIVQPDSPPANIVDAIAIPEGVGPGSLTATSGHSDTYDESMQFQAATSQAALITFYRTEMARLGWRVYSTGPAPNGAGIEVLGQKAGTDGWYWEMGAIVAPTTFAGGAQTTSFTIRLFQAPDPA
jgi:hypothetical protein